MRQNLHVLSLLITINVKEYNMTNKILITLLTFAISIIAISCKDSKEVINLTQIPESSISLQKSELDFQTLFPKEGCVRDSFLILFDPKDKDGFLHIYNKNDGTFLTKYGTKGEGPNDFINPRPMFNKNIRTSDKEIQIGDVDAVYCLDIESMIHHIDEPKKIAIKIPDELRLYNYVLHNSDSLLIVNQTRDYQLTFYNKQNTSLELKNYFNMNRVSKEASNFCNVMQVYDAYYSSNNRTIAIAYKNWKQIDLISLNGELIKQLYFPNFNSNANEMSFKNGSFELSENAQMYFSYIFPEKDYFYALCWEDTRANIKKGLATPSIYKINWDGEVKHIYHLDKEISYFCIDFNKLYAVGVSSKDDLDLNLFTSILE